MSTKVITQSKQHMYTVQVAEPHQEPILTGSDLHERLFNRILASLVFVGENNHGEEFFSAKWEWGGHKEVYHLRRKDVSNFVSDVLYEHPRCWDYRKASIALVTAEQGIVHPVTHMYCGPKPWFVDYYKYKELRTEMMDLSLPYNDSVYTSIIELGPNPTQGLSEDKNESKRLAGLLLYKSWRTKKDFISKRSVESCRESLLKELFDNPIKAMQNNGYAYGALKEHSGSWN